MKSESEKAQHVAPGDALEATAVDPSDRASITPIDPTQRQRDIAYLASRAYTQAVEGGYIVKNRRAFVASARRELEGEAPLDVQRMAYHARRTEHRARVERETGRKWTGWRWVRGAHSGTYVEDPEGTDVPSWW